MSVDLGLFDASKGSFMHTQKVVNEFKGSFMHTPKLVFFLTTKSEINLFHYQTQKLTCLKRKEKY